MGEIIELLLNTEQADIVVQNIASYVIYLYPGIISIVIYNFFDAKTTKDSRAFIIKGFAISYLYNLFIGVLIPYICFFRGNLDKNSITYNAILIIIAFLVPYCCYKFRMSKIFVSICERLGISTSATNIPFELLGDSEEKYTCLKIYLKDEPYAYIGYLGEYEYEEGNEKYVILTGYRKYLINPNLEEKLVIGYDREEYNEKFFVRYSDIKYIEKIGENRAREKIYTKKKKSCLNNY